MFSHGFQWFRPRFGRVSAWFRAYFGAVEAQKRTKAEVWVPDSASHIDSTACRDFGFPSTHAMNSMSASAYRPYVGS